MFTLFDVIICVIILLSSILAFIRGGARDTLSLLAWVIAAFLTIYFYPYLYEKADDYFKSSMTASLIVIIPTFIVFLTIFSVLAAAILGNMISLKQGVLDRSFGAFVGFVKGLAIVSVIHFCITLVANEEPAWLTNGETYKLTSFGADVVGDIADNLVSNNEITISEETPETLSDQFSRMLGDSKDYTNTLIEEVENVEMDAFEQDFIDGDEEFVGEEVFE